MCHYSKLSYRKLSMNSLSVDTNGKRRTCNQTMIDIKMSFYVLSTTQDPRNKRQHKIEINLFYLSECHCKCTCLMDDERIVALISILVHVFIRYVLKAVRKQILSRSLSFSSYRWDSWNVDMGISSCHIRKIPVAPFLWNISWLQYFISTTCTKRRAIFDEDQAFFHPPNNNKLSSIN